MEKLYKATNIEISFDANSHIMYCNWIGYQSRDIIIKSGWIIFDLLKRHQVKKILNDNSLVKGSWWQAAVWAAEEWFPKMIEAGLTHFAWILSPNIFTELSAKRAMQPYCEVVKTFNSFNDANDWLLKTGKS